MKIIELEKLKGIIATSPTPDFEQYVREVINHFSFLIKSGENIESSELADRIAEVYSLENEKTLIDYSALKHYPILIKGLSLDEF